MATATCRRCSECRGAKHHWIDDEDSPTLMGCKHCPVIGLECASCMGGEEHCIVCGAEGYIAVVRADAYAQLLAACEAALVAFIEQAGITNGRIIGRLRAAIAAAKPPEAKPDGSAASR